MLKDRKKNGETDDSKPDAGSGQGAGTPLSPDRRISALVRFIARRAAEEDYQELLQAIDRQEDQERQ